MNTNREKEERLYAFAAAALAALLLFAAPARASFDDLGAGARAPGMGSAFTAVADDIYAIYYNPAGLALLERPEFAASHAQHLAGLSDGSGIFTSFIGYARPLNKDYGTLGAAIQNFSIDGSFYNERAIYLSYGRHAPESFGMDGLYWGVNLKSLRRSFGSLPEASNSYYGLTATGLADPVLSGKSSVSAFDADLGLLYRVDDNYSAALELMHLTRPDMAFSSNDSDKLPLKAKLGFAYSRKLSRLAAQYDTVTAPNGSRDHRLTMAIERWIPWLKLGNIGARAALSVGNRDFRQATAGLSYRAGHMNVDYGFSIPINSIASVSGTHRLSFSLCFGEAVKKEAAKHAEEMPAQAPEAVAPEAKAPELEAPEEVAPEVIAAIAEHMQRTRFMETEGRYREAAEELSKALQLDPKDEQMLLHQNRLNFLVVQIGRLSDYKTNEVQAALYRSALAYLDGQYMETVNQASYASGLQPENRDISNYLTQLELATGLKSKKIELPEQAAAEVASMLAQATKAIEDSRYAEAVTLSEAVLKIQPENVAALGNLGVANMALGNYQKSLEAWEKAYKLETGLDKLATINSHISSVENILKLKKSKAAAAQKPKPKAPPSAADREQTQKLYRVGLDLYSSGELEKARTIFKKVLEAEPDNVPAANALKRVERELSDKV